MKLLVMKDMAGVEQALAMGAEVRGREMVRFFMGKKAVHKALRPHRLYSCK
jgi:hypothetical protein